VLLLLVFCGIYYKMYVWYSYFMSILHLHHDKLCILLVQFLTLYGLMECIINEWMNELNVWRYSRCITLTEVVITKFSCIFIHKRFPSVLQVAHWVSTKGRERTICRQQNDLQWFVGVHDIGRKLWNGMWGTSVTRIECWSREPHLLSRGSK
jgi:hypothetical protein